MKKFCSKCKFEKEERDFPKGKKQCKLCVQAKQQEWVQKNKAHVLKYFSEYRSTHKEENKHSQRFHALKVRLHFIKHYGSKCECCWETNPYFLTVISEAFNQDKNKYTNQHIFEWLRKIRVAKEELPRAQVFCQNCLFSIKIFKKCGHKVHQSELNAHVRETQTTL